MCAPKNPLAAPRRPICGRFTSDAEVRHWPDGQLAEDVNLAPGALAAHQLWRV